MKFFLSALFTILMMIGCQDTSNITDPIDNPYSDGLNKKPSHEEYELISLPTKAAEWQGATFSVSKQINGNTGGQVQMFDYYVTSSGLPFYIFISLNIPKNAFTGTQTITMTLDDEYAYIHFYPEMDFNKDLILNQYFQGIDLIQFGGNYLQEMDFVYIDDDGKLEVIEKNSVTLNNIIGLVKIEGARIPHFSRFGWIRLQGSGI